MVRPGRMTRGSQVLYTQYKDRKVNMNNEQKLEVILNQYRQLLADEQLKTTSLNVELQIAHEKIKTLQEELDGNVQEKGSDTAGN